MWRARLGELALLAACHAALTHARRVEKRTNFEVGSVADCPTNPGFDPKQYCIDKDTFADVPEECCDFIGKCRTEIDSRIQEGRNRLSLVIERCDLNMSSDASREGGFILTRPEKLCTEECQGTTELNEDLLTSDQGLRQKCKKVEEVTERFSVLDETVLMEKEFQKAFSACRTPRTTVTTTVTETTTALTNSDTDLFEPVKDGNSVFVVDISASMNARVCQGSSSCGKSRFEMVAEQLIKVVQDLSDKQKFNIVAFNHRFTSLNGALVPATPQWKSQAVKWIRSLSPNGFTNYQAPLRFALSQSGVDVVHLLSDGQPTRDCTNIFCMPIKFAPEVGFASLSDMEITKGVYLSALQILQNESAILAASRAAGLSTDQDSLRTAALGKLGFVKDVKPASGTVQLDVADVGQAWFPAQALFRSELPILFEDLRAGDRVQVISDFKIVRDACIRNGVKVSSAKERQINSVLGKEVDVLEVVRNKFSGTRAVRIRSGTMIVELGAFTLTPLKVQAKDIPIHTTLFSPGEGAEKLAARRLLQRIAHVTKGAYRERYE